MTELFFVGFFNWGPRGKPNNFTVSNRIKTLRFFDDIADAKSKAGCLLFTDGPDFRNEGISFQHRSPATLGVYRSQVAQIPFYGTQPRLAKLGGWLHGRGKVATGSSQRASGTSSLQRLFRVEVEVMPFLAGLPYLHKDPLDRLLVAQALQHDLRIATVDQEVVAYQPQLIPAT